MPENLNIAKNRILDFRLLIDTPEGLYDVSDYLVDLEIERGDTSRIGTGQSGIDNTVATMSFTLHNDGRVGDTERVNFSPRDEDSPMNNWDGEYNPLLFPNVEVIFQIAMFDYRDKSQLARWEVIEDDTWEEYEDMTWEELIEHVEDTATFDDITWPVEDDWITMFQGFLGDDIRVSAHEVTCELRDLAKPMQDTLVEELQEYGDTDNPPTAEEVIREIMDENGFEDYPFDPDEDSDGSGFSITEYQVEYVSVWQAIQEIAAERGWFLGFRWDTDEGEYRLKFLEPDRAMDADNADYEIDWATDFYDDEFNLSDKDIRNACKVVYRNRDSGEIENVTYEDQDSIDTYGRKFMQFEEEDTSLIDTEEEADQLAEAVVKDLRELPAGQEVTLPICPELDVLIGVNINDPRLSSTEDFVGIESVRHSFTFGNNPSYETYIVGSGYVSGGHKKWIDRDARSGVKKPIDVGTVKNQIVGNSITVAAKDSSPRGKRGADYLCKGENDGATINKAIDSLDKGRVVLLEGTYYLTDNSISLEDNITLEGQGNNTIIEGNLAEDFHIICRIIENVRIKNMFLKGGEDSGGGISIAGCLNAKVHDVKFEDFTGDDILKGVGAIYLEGVVSTGWDFEQNEFTSIKDCEIINCRRGLNLSEGKRGRVINNHIRNTFEHGIFVQGGTKDFNFSENRIKGDNTAAAVEFVDGSEDNYFHNNNMKGSLDTSETTTTIIEDGNNIIRDNIIDDGSFVTEGTS